MRKVFGGFLTATLALALGLFAAPAANASTQGLAATGTLRPGGLIHLLAPPHDGAATSTNWAGYVNTGRTYTQSSATWTQPAVTCGTKATYSSFWVGIGGYTGSSNLDQTGVEADCSGGAAVYKAWWEVLPAAETVIPSITVHPGDTFNASVTGSLGNYTMTLTDVTTGASFSTTQSDPANKGVSAEVIAEATSLCTIFACQVQPLSNFGTVNFRNGRANNAAINANPYDVVTMAGGLFGGTVKAQPSGLNGTGDGFSVVWKHN